MARPRIALRCRHLLRKMAVRVKVEYTLDRSPLYRRALFNKQINNHLSFQSEKGYFTVVEAQKCPKQQQISRSVLLQNRFLGLRRLTTSCYITQSRLWVLWLKLSDGDAPCPVLKTQLVGVDGLWSTPQIYRADVLECTRNLWSPEPTRDSIWHVCILEVILLHRATIPKGTIILFLWSWAPKFKLTLKSNELPSSATMWCEIWAGTMLTHPKTFTSHKIILTIK